MSTVMAILTGRRGNPQNLIESPVFTNYVITWLVSQCLQLLYLYIDFKNDAEQFQLTILEYQTNHRVTFSKNNYDPAIQ